MTSQRCPDCGEWTTLRMCDKCAAVADRLGLTVDERLTQLRGGDPT